MHLNKIITYYSPLFTLCTTYTFVFFISELIAETHTPTCFPALVASCDPSSSVPRLPRATVEYSANDTFSFHSFADFLYLTTLHLCLPAAPRNPALFTISSSGQYGIKALNS